MKTKLLIFFLILATLFGCVGCTNTPPTSENSGKDEQFVPDYNYNICDYTEYAYTMGAITGDTSPNYSKANDVGGTDLGFPVYDDTRDRMYFLFGDTFAKRSMTGNWRSNVIAYVDNYSTSNFLEDFKFTGWICNEDGMAVPAIQGLQLSNNSRTEVTKIPTGGICINGTFYMFYMSVRYWGVGGSWDVNYNGVIKSTDGGETWERVFDLTWLESATNQYAERALRFANQTVELTDTDVISNAADRVAPNFMMIAPVDGKDGYIYLFGSQGGRNGGMQMARVKKENFETFNEYEYFIGYDAQKAPMWEKGPEGMKKLDSDLNTSKSLVMSQPVGETTVFYNPYLEKWVMTDNYFNVVYMAMSKNVYGPYSKKFAILDLTYDYGVPGSYVELYAGFSHEKMLKDDGQTMFMVISYMDKIYNSQMLRVKFA